MCSTSGSTCRPVCVVERWHHCPRPPPLSSLMHGASGAALVVGISGGAAILIQPDTRKTGAARYHIIEDLIPSVVDTRCGSSGHIHRASTRGCTSTVDAKELVIGSDVSGV